ncbi:MAG: hypothetical protein ACTSRW_09380 [Candidatus Helarchaeota archaeon]
MNPIPVFGLYDLFVGIAFFSFTPIYLYIAKKHWEDNRYAAYSAIITTIGTILVGIHFIITALPILISAIFATTVEQINGVLYVAIQMPLPYPISSFVFYFCSFVVLYILGFYLIESKRKEFVDAKEQKTEVHPLDKEVSRKLFHICIIAVIVCYLIIGELIAGGIFDVVYRIFQYYFGPNAAYFLMPINSTTLANFPQLSGQAITVFVFSILIILLVWFDFLRIFDYRFYPMKELEFVYRNKEKNVLGPHVHLLTGCLFAALYFPGPIAISAIAMTGFGDAMATIVGVSVGTKKIKPLGRKSSKTREGCIGGFVGSFVFGFISYYFVASKWFLGVPIPFLPFQILSSAIIINLVGAGVFLLFDYLDPPVSDNIFNPILISIVQFVVTILIFPQLIVYPQMIT